MSEPYKQPTDTEFSFDEHGHCELTLRLYLGSDASAERILEGYPEGIREAYCEARAADEEAQLQASEEQACYVRHVESVYDESRFS